MEIDEQLLVISNLPSRDKDEEDLDTLLYVGLCLNQTYQFPQKMMLMTLF